MVTSSLLQKHSIIFITVAACTLSAAYFIYNWLVLPLGEQPTIYWWHASARITPLLLGLLVLPAFILLTGILTWRGKWITRSLAGTTLLLTLLLVSTIASCAATLPSALEQNRFIGSVTTPDHVYHLDMSSKPGVGGDGRVMIALWECDSIGWLCSIIYRDERDVSGGNLDAVNTQIRLSPDDQRVQVMANEEIIYQHIP